MKYGIAIFPSKEIQDAANAFRKRYDPEYTYVAPHITLKSAFQMDMPLREKVVEELKNIVHEMKPFPIKITKVRSFAPVTYTIFFKVEPSQELTLLNEKLHSGIFPSEREHPFVPHITIAQDLKEDEYSDIYESLRMKYVQFDDVVDRIQLCYQLDNGTWKVLETFVFGQEK